MPWNNILHNVGNLYSLYLKKVGKPKTRLSEWIIYERMFHLKGGILRNSRTSSLCMPVFGLHCYSTLKILSYICFNASTGANDHWLAGGGRRVFWEVELSPLSRCHGWKTCSDSSPAKFRQPVLQLYKVMRTLTNPFFSTILFCIYELLVFTGTYSIVLMAVEDSNLKFTLVDVGAYGRQCDGGTLEASRLGKLLTRGLTRPCKVCCSRPSRARFVE